MRTAIRALMIWAVLALGCGAASAQVTITGVGGAREQMLPSTVGVDPRPDRETLKARRTMRGAIGADPQYYEERRYYARPHRYSHRPRYYRYDRY